MVEPFRLILIVFLSMTDSFPNRGHLAKGRGLQPNSRAEALKPFGTRRAALVNRSADGAKHLSQIVRILSANHARAKT